MATSSLNAKSLLNLSYLTENCGTKICRKLFLKRVTDLKPTGADDESWTVDKFLKFKKQEIIESKKLKKYSLEKVFPVERDCTHLDEWDLSLFCCILGVTCELDYEYKLPLNALKRLRNKLAHMGDADVDDKKCKHSKEKLKYIFEKFLDYLKDKELETTIQEMFTKADIGHVSDNEIAQTLRVMRDSYEEMKADIVSCKEETINSVKAEHKETREKLEKGQSRLEKLLTEIHHHVVRSERDTNSCMEEVPVVGLEIGTTNSSPETEENFSEMMVELFNAEITNDPSLSFLSNSNHHQLRETIHTVCESFKAKGYVIIKAERRCILLHIKCSSISTLLSLYIEYMQGILDESLSELQTAAQCIDKFKDIHIEAILYENDVYETLTSLDLTQSKCIDAAKNEIVNMKNSTNKKSEVITAGKSNTFMLHVKLPSHLHQSDFETLVSSETSRLAEELNVGEQLQTKLVILGDSENKVKEFPNIQHTRTDDSFENLEESPKSISVKLDTEVTLNSVRDKCESKQMIVRNLHDDNASKSTDSGDEITVKRGHISRISETTQLLAPEVRTTYGLHSNIKEPESTHGFKGVMTKLLLRLRSDDGSRRKVVNCTKIRVESVRCFRRGQHVAIPGRVGKIYISLTRKQKFLYMKHCIVSNVIESAGTRVKMNIIYFSKKGLIKQATESFDLRFDEMYIVEYTEEIRLPDEIVDNAESVLRNPRGEYASILKSFTDSESFATWCSVGEGETMQRLVRGKMRNILSSAADEKEKIHSLSVLMKGDIISFPKYGFEHELIVSDNETKTCNSVSGNIRCIHYRPSIFGRREIVEEYIFINLDTTTVKVHRFPIEKSYPPNVVVERARKRIGETKWAANSNRSCHFCFWAKMKQRPREDIEEQDNSVEFYAYSKSDVLSSLFVEKIDVHLMNDILVGDVVNLENMCIVEHLRSLDSEFGREFEMQVIFYDSSWIARRKTIHVNLNKDTVIITKYHPAHCQPMTTRVNRAKFWLNTKCRWWTTAGFINDCILLYP